MKTLSYCSLGKQKKWPLPCKGCCNFFLYAMFCAQSGFLLACFCALTRFLLRATELEHDEVLCSLCTELVFHYNKSILFNLTLSMRFEAHAYSCDSCINTYLDKFSLLTSCQDSWDVGISLLLYLFPRAQSGCCMPIFDFNETQENPAKGWCSGTEHFLFWHLFPFLVCWGTVQAGALSWTRHGPYCPQYKSPPGQRCLYRALEMWVAAILSSYDNSDWRNFRRSCSIESQLWPFKSWKHPVM